MHYLYASDVQRGATEIRKIINSSLLMNINIYLIIVATTGNHDRVF